ncbi:MAG TPA: type II toxin-antitoxin system prevent-host-death family antitoxin [Bauldia sp.]|nr:type II toxin-antitoxin system prevent-host-death family antitoxin [Bauldia sp.]
MAKTVNLYEAKTQLSRLVEEAAAGEEIVIAKNGVAKAKLVPVPVQPVRRKPANVMKITYIAPDFDAIDPEIIRLFEGD